MECRFFLWKLFCDLGKKGSKDCVAVLKAKGFNQVFGEDFL